MVKLLEIGYTEIPTLAGVKYTHNNLEEGIRCVELYDRTFTIFLGNDQVRIFRILMCREIFMYLFKVILGCSFKYAELFFVSSI